MTQGNERMTAGVVNNGVVDNFGLNYLGYSFFLGCYLKQGHLEYLVDFEDMGLATIF